MKLKLLLALLQGASAFPSSLHHVVRESIEEGVEERAAPGCGTSTLCNKKVNIPDSKIQVVPSGKATSAGRDNCGVGSPCLLFDPKEQYVSTRGKHRWIAPKKGDIRGPCPGLNAAANHGYLPRTGILTIDTTTNGLFAAYGMEQELGAFLAVFSIAIVGDVLTQTWSLGGPPPAAPVAGVFPQGISYSHNKYEGDSSIGRCDAYTNNGDAHSLSPVRFAYAYGAGMDTDRYTFDKFAFEFTKNTFRSEMTNPLYFMPPVAGTVVSPAAYNFVIAFMSNHTAEEPGGYLDGKQFKTFFSIVGDYPNFKWQPGLERIPDNWYRRPGLNGYRATDVFTELVPSFAAYPQSFRLGGNSNGVNTWTGVDIANFTGGAFNAQNLLKGNNLACFFTQALQAGAADQLKGGFNAVKPALDLLNKQIGKTFAFASCKKVNKYNTNVLTGYPGHKYSPTGPANTC